MPVAADTHALTFADLDRLRPILHREARRMMRIARLPAQEREDVEQDMLLDLITRLARFDPSRGTLEAFATLCFRHCGIRLAERLRRERERHHLTAFDDVVSQEGDPGGRLTLAETLPEADGLPAWWGKPCDAAAVVERRLDLNRAAAALDPRDRPLCAALSAASAHETVRASAHSRASFYRRIREVRLRLLAAGIASAA
ncbi:MAG: hypothetical protein IT204_26180 [Fimbriimonadaceae bacterium]|nr:hypothetical protein [Fimbriimonadaceae bacterium]